MQGVYPSTNQAVVMARADGRSHLARRRADERGYAVVARGWRLAAAMEARRRKLGPFPADGRVSLAFWLVRHHRFDPSAWTMAAKWIEDGLTDAKVLASDRRNVYQVAGRVCQTEEESAAVLRRRAATVLDTGRPGMLVEFIPEETL